MGDSSWSLTALSAGAAATRSLASSLARVCRPGDVILLAGGLGAGKTTFAQGFARGLGVAGPVTSPTFTLVREYRCHDAPVRTLLHADVYRLDSLTEVVDLGLPELVEDDAVALVEWGDVAAPVLGDSWLQVTLDREPEPVAAPGGGEPAPAASPGHRESGPEASPDDEPRRLAFIGRGPAWAGRRPAVARALGLETRRTVPTVRWPTAR